MTITSREEWWRFCEKNVLKLDILPTFEDFCQNKILWTNQPLVTKFKYTFSEGVDNIFVDIIRLKDKKTKRYYFLKTDLYYPLAIRAYNQFMSSLTDDQCEAMMKG